MALQRFFYRLAFLDVNQNVSFEINNLNLPDFGVYIGIEFDIEKSSYQNLNSLNLNIFNLAPDERNKLVKSYIQADRKLFLTLSVGTQENELVTLFQGSIYECKANKEDVDLNTRIKAYDGGDQVQNAFASFSLSPGATVLDLKKELSNSMGLPFVSNSVLDANILNQGWASSSESVWQDTKRLFKSHDDVFIDNERLFFYDENYYTNLSTQNSSSLQAIPLITEQSGLLEITNIGITIEVNAFFKPDLLRGDLVKVEETAGVDQRFNGIYKVIGLKHNMRISSTTIGSHSSTFELRIVNRTNPFLN